MEFLRGTGSPTNARVRAVVRDGHYGMTDVIAAELLAGAGDADELRRVQAIIDTARFYPVRPLFDYELAAELYRQCRRAGVTPRSLADCTIAAVAITNDLAVLAVDRDMEMFATHAGMQLATA